MLIPLLLFTQLIISSAPFVALAQSPEEAPQIFPFKQCYSPYDFVKLENFKQIQVEGGSSTVSGWMIVADLILAWNQLTEGSTISRVQCTPVIFNPNFISCSDSWSDIPKKRNSILIFPEDRGTTLAIWTNESAQPWPMDMSSLPMTCQ